MHVRFTQSYAGPAGLFAKDLVYDLPPATLDQIPQDHYRPVPAPWDPAGQVKATQGKRKRAKRKQTRSPKDKQLRPGKDEGYQTK